MSNYCFSDMEIKGSVKEIIRFIKDNFDYVLFDEIENEYLYMLEFEKFLPTPIKEGTVDKVIDNWYEWRMTNWGCDCSTSYDQSIILFINNEDGTTYSSISNNERFDKFDYDYLDRLINDENINDKMTARLLVNFKTFYLPAYNIARKWVEVYPDLELRIVFYEPTINYFAGVIDNQNKEYNLEEYSVDEDEAKYIEFLLEEGIKALDWYQGLVDGIKYEIDRLEDIELANKLMEELNQRLEKLDSNFSRGLLIAGMKKQLSM